MIIIYNTDKTVNGDEKHEDYFTALLSDGLKRYEESITKIEAHVSDKNGSKKGEDDIRCVLEARLAGRQPIVVTCDAGTTEKAVSGAIEKLTSVIKTTLGRLQNY